MGYRSDKDINLYKVLKNTKTKSKKGSGKPAWIIPPLVILLLLSGAFAYFYYQNKNTQLKINEINLYLNNNQIIAKHKESEELQNKQKELNNEKNRLDKFNGTISTYPRLNKEVFRLIEESIKDKIIIYDITYSDSKGLLQMEATALDIGAASAFTNDLYQTGLFEKVNYSGWNLGSNNRYSFAVTCILKVENQEVE